MGEYKYAVNSIDNRGQVRHTPHYTLPYACEAFRKSKAIAGIVHCELVKYDGDNDVTLAAYQAPKRELV